MDANNRLPLSLLLLRLGVFIVMFMWTLDKFVHPEHAAKIFESFYFMGGLGGSAMYVVAVVEVLIILGFIVGYRKKYTYGAVFILHAISTLSSMPLYFAPFDGANLLFFAAWPMLAACFTLYSLRDQDTLWTCRSSQ